jgi:hypothetical protein
VGRYELDGDPVSHGREWWALARIVALLLIGSAGCGSDPAGPGATPSPVGSTATVAVSEGWLAVIAVDADPSELDRLTQDLLPIGGAAFVVSPSECFEGLPAAHADAGYVLGFLSEDRAVIDDLLERAERPALFVARVRSRCTD